MLWLAMHSRPMQWSDLAGENQLNRFDELERARFFAREGPLKLTV